VTGAGNVTYTGSSFAPGKFVVSGGGTFNFNGPANLPASGGFTGAGDGSSGTINILGGTLTTACSVFIGNNSTSSINVSAGTLHVTGANFVMGDGYNNGGGGKGTLSLSGTGAINLGATTGLFSIGNSGAGTGTVNLDGGTLSLNKTIAKGTYSTGTGHANVLNFNGGTLQATGASLTMSGLTQANVRNGGATIDTQGFNITLAQPLIHSTLGGDNAIDGGLTKLGSGILTLSGAYTYTGLTSVNAGTLLLNATNTGTGAITITSGATLGGSGSAAGAITVNAGGTITAGPDTGTTGTFTAGGGLTLASNSEYFFKLSSNDPSSASGYTAGGAPPNGGGAAGTWDQLSFTTLAVTSSPDSPAKLTLDYIGTGTFNTAQSFSIPIAYGPANSINNGAALAANLLVLDTANSSLPAGTSASNFSLAESADDSAIDLVFTPTAAPEPGSAVLLGLAMAGLLTRRRRRFLKHSS
jgi:autotransporter-associated beta strand protein